MARQRAIYARTDRYSVAICDAAGRYVFQGNPLPTLRLARIRAGTVFIRPGEGLVLLKRVGGATPPVGWAVAEEVATTPLIG